MVLTTYYDILGISQSAGIQEIKSAFRRLAKLYHPDKNPGEKETFAGILRAYETLVDPSLRNAYDRKLRYQQQLNTSAERAKSKTWTFEEREQRRRKYYEEHIKQYEKARPVYPSREKPENPYNEFKYILFATPLAVALLLLMFQLAQAPEEEVLKSPPLAASLQPKLKQQKDFSAPFASSFGGEKKDSNSQLALLLNNGMGLDVVICLFRKDKFIRSVFLQKDSSAQLRQLPKGKYMARLAIGKEFDPDKKGMRGKVKGGFVGDVFFYFTKSSFTLDKDRTFDLDRNLYNSLVQVEEEVFFETKP